MKPKKLVPKALPVNAKKEARKSKVEKKADALIKAQEQKAAAKKAAKLAAEKKAAADAAAYRYAREARERYEEANKNKRLT